MSSDQSTPCGSSRRSFIAGAGAVAAVAGLGMPAIRVRAAEVPVVLVSWGGFLAQAIKEAWSDPFTKETGIPVLIAEGPDLAKVKAQIMTGNADWDVLDLPGSMAAAGSRAGYWAPVDRGIVDTSQLLVQSQTPDLVRMYSYAGGNGWDPSRFPAGKAPRTFTEFFDTTRFPGSRAMRARVSETLEMALVASGVAPDKLYPLDAERAFKMLDKIKPSVRKWVTETAQMTSLLQSGEVDYSYVYTSRVRTAQDAHVPMEMSMDQTVIGGIYFGVPKSSKNITSAMKFINFCLRSDRQAHWSNLTTGIPNAKGAAAKVDRALSKWIPDVSDPKHVIINDQYWAEHYEALQARMQEWLLT
jgi:putative spermidine/putrescine transport system substrate-binding protein